MTAPRWIDKLRGLLQREDMPDEGALQPKDHPSPPSVVDPKVESTPSTAQTFHLAQPATEAPTSQIAHATRPNPPLPPSHHPRPETPTKLLDSRALSEMGMRLLASVGHHFLQQISKLNVKITPGLEHDTSLLVTGYAVVSAAIRKAHGDAGNEALRTLRSNVKNALLAALRKHYHRMAPDELKLGANMVTYVDELIALADSTDATAPQPFEPLYARLASAFGGEGPSGELAARFGETLQAQLALAIEQVSKAH